MASNPLSCGAQCSKITLITLNIIFMLCGLAMLVIGLLFRFGSGTMKDEMEDMLDFDVKGFNFYDLINALAIIFIIAGLIVIIFSLLGFVGAACEAKGCLMFYAVLVFLVLLLELVGVVLFFIMSGNFKDAVRAGLKKNIEKANEPQRSFQQAAEYMMIEFECCHVSNLYLIDYGTAQDMCATSGTAFSTDCYDALKEKVENYQIPLVVIAIVVMFVELMCIVMACWLFRAYRKGLHIV